MTSSRPVGRVVLITLLASVANPLSALAQPPAASENEAHPYDDLLTLYRSGAIERAVEGLNRLLGVSGAERQATRWISTAHDANRRADLEAALLLYTDAIMIAWRNDSPYPTRVLTLYVVPFQRLRLALKRMDPRTRFLRVWYLLWESFRQVHVNQSVPIELDYLDDALAAFPKDAQILLAAGSRQQLTWWTSLENAQRDPDGAPVSITKFLTIARGYLRRSVAADPKETEARLRLINVLLDLNDLENASRVLAVRDWSREDPTFEYLARLFEGDLHERRGNRPAAAAAYDRAIALVEVPQAARVARAHLAHLDGQRSQAAAIMTPALSNQSDRLDPWWPYLRGQAWRFDSHLKIAHSLVMK